ncbi:GNAT family N-acetyltransferase [Maribacter sp. HTCC2170]|uniref:GNAT family N-acetyltransferase n=1 Tax=Maribacter sp. (strain HTCC2170 / KCCM 42371) TaxID=313603 RepID=UPI00006B4813|nr:GNAT family protein [Maribacter sp. HTCC2170]EAR01547.1 putative acetyltransferase [Maribacter sp. HTCC2170]
MVNLKGEHIQLRAIEPKDLDFLYELENNPAIWEISGTTKPYAKHVLKEYLDNAHRDIFEVKQLRLCICKEDKVIGLIDLFDFDPKNKRAGVGIVVMEKENRDLGHGSEALELLSKYTSSILGLRQLYANVMENNKRSLHLFKKLGYEEIGVKKDWIFSNGEYKNEILLQKLFR